MYILNLENEGSSFIFRFLILTISREKHLSLDGLFMKLCHFSLFSSFHISVSLSLFLSFFISSYPLVFNFS